MQIIEFDCQHCGFHDPEIPAVGWTDGLNYIIMSCPECGREQPTVEYKPCD